MLASVPPQPWNFILNEEVDWHQSTTLDKDTSHNDSTKLDPKTTTMADATKTPFVLDSRDFIDANTRAQLVVMMVPINEQVIKL